METRWEKYLFVLAVTEPSSKPRTEHFAVACDKRPVCWSELDQKKKKKKEEGGGEEKEEQRRRKAEGEKRRRKKRGSEQE